MHKPGFLITLTVVEHSVFASPPVTIKGTG
jgi:hypothetical protein